MKLATFQPNGNEKLGRRVAVVNRPVGESCPQSCVFLHNGCYAERTENRFPDARKSAARNLSLAIGAMRRMVDHAVQNAKPIRWHERGDFCRQDSIGRSILDVPYLATIEDSLDYARAKYGFFPRSWSYTHYFHKRIAALTDRGVAIYASCHNESDVRRARDRGFDLIAYVSTTRKRKGLPMTDHPKRTTLPIVDSALT